MRTHSGKILKAAVLALSLLVSAASFADAPDLPNVKCGPNANGGEVVWLDTVAHRIWVNKEDDLSSALRLQTVSWMSQAPFMIQAVGRFGAYGTYELTVAPAPEASKGTLVLVITADDGSRDTLSPVGCASIK